MIACLCSCTFLLLAGRLARGYVRRYPENALVLTGGIADADTVLAWHDEKAKVLPPAQAEVVWERLIEPFMTSEDGKQSYPCSYTVIRRDNGDVAAILRYGTRMGIRELLLGEEGDGNDEEDLAHVYGKCVSSEFNTLRRLMINFKGEEP
ncbi:MAG: hypothetical protein IKF78_03080 [Atopobiaceae bacterium]|nr:hypothetical protein [Atopobiaceae bacterium]